MSCPDERFLVQRSEPELLPYDWDFTCYDPPARDLGNAILNSRSSVPGMRAAALNNGSIRRDFPHPSLRHVSGCQ